MFQFSSHMMRIIHWKKVMFKVLIVLFMNVNREREREKIK